MSPTPCHFLEMTAIDISALSPRERLDLIGRLWDSLEAEAIPLDSTQEAELDRRLAALDDDIKHARSAEAVLAEFRARYR